MKVLSILLVVSAFFLLRPYQLAQSGLLYAGLGGDDYYYSAHSTSLTFFEFPNYSKEGTARNHYPLHSIGPALMAWPFTVVFSTLDRISGSDIVRERTDLNVNLSWTTFGFVFASVFYLWLGCWFLYRGLCYHFSQRTSEWATILTVLFSGVPLFAYRRPVFSHVYELCLQAVGVFFLLRRLKNPLQNPHPLAVGLLCGLMMLVRYNNIPMALAWMGFFYFYLNRDFRALLKASAVIGAMILVFRVIPRIGMEPDNYIALNARIMFRLFDFTHYIKRIIKIFIGIDWGLIFTAPAVLLGVILSWKKDFPFKKQILLLCAPLMINFYIVVSWGSQGGWYGYRYLVHSFAPLSTVAIAYWIQNTSIAALKQNRIHLAGWGIFAALCVQSALSMVSFEGNPTNLTQQLMQLDALKDYGNPTFQIEIWKTILHAPKEYIMVLLKAGPAYLIYLASILFGFFERLPQGLSEKYPNFEPVVLVRYLILLFLPLLLWGSTRLSLTLRSRTLK